MGKGTARKKQRLEALKEILLEKKVGTQWEILMCLRERGFDVTLATVSRDLREIGAIKVVGKDGKIRYYLPPGGERLYEEIEKTKFRQEMEGLILWVGWSENDVIVRTPSGGAPRLGAIIDSLGWEEVLGTVAGNDVLLIVVKNKKQAPIVAKKLEEMMHIEVE